MLFSLIYEKLTSVVSSMRLPGVNFAEGQDKINFVSLLYSMLKFINEVQVNKF